MRKKWIKYYLLIGNVVILVLSALCSLGFIRSNLIQLREKKTFESIYTDTSIDFIVPSPSYMQVDEMETNGDDGIGMVTPYYEISSNVTCNSSNIKGVTIILPDENKIQYTPYNTSRILSGNKMVAAGNAVVDKLFLSNNTCSIGDTVTVSIAERNYDFVISGICETNTYYKDGTILVVLSSDQMLELESYGIQYSAAYVCASDYEKCRNYLYSQYKPLGRMKDASAFETQEAFDRHVENFYEADWTKEITNCKDNYSSLSTKYENVEIGMLRNVIIGAIIVFLTSIFLNVLLLRSEDLFLFFKTILIKKSGTKEEIRSFYKRGIFCNAIFFIVSMVAFYGWMILNDRPTRVDKSFIGVLLIVGTQMIATLIMSLISSNYVEKKYSTIVKNINDQADTPADNESNSFE